MNVDLRTERATLADAPAVAALVADAFDPIPIVPWLVPDPVERQRILPAYFQLLVEHATVHGTVEITADGTAAAVWAPAGRPDLPDIVGYDQQVRAICGRHTVRFQALDAAMHTQHPCNPPHDHLLFLAVRPDRQGRGTGGGLLRAHHARLDAAGRPAYLEASSVGSARLYQRHGYVRLGAPFRPQPDCPGQMIPMWRHPAR